MNRRTYEILAKWICRQHRVSVEFEPGVCPMADIKNNKILLPSDVKEENAFGALAHLMHEAAHIRYTKELPNDIVDDALSKNILNAIEDIRIDLKNFRLLPNVHEFYKRGMEFDLAEREKLDLSQIALPKKCMVNGIYELEGMPEGKIKEKAVIDFNKKHQVVEKMEEAVNAIDRKDWKTTKAIIAYLFKTFGFDKLPKQPLPQEGEGKGKGTCPNCKGSGVEPNGSQGSNQGEGTGDTSGDKDEPCSVCGGSGQLDMDTSDLKGNKAVWAKGQGTGTGVGNSELGEIAIQELTRNRFKEILNVKEVRVISDGNKVDTDNLAAFFTGDIDELFKEEQIVHKKKSKIIILLDGSGSMDSRLLDGGSCRKVVSGCCKAMTDILDEVSELEGINVDYLIHGFTGGYYEFQKETWQKEFARINGGTDLIGAFSKAQDIVLKDQEVDGNRLMIVMTDGEVSNSEIREMKRRITAHGADVRCMIIGVGADPGGDMCKDICGDNNIIAKESADLILLETIMTMLDAY